MPSRFLPSCLCLLVIGACAAPTDEVVGHTEEALSFSGSFATPGIVYDPRMWRPTIEVPRGCNRNVMIGIAENASSCPRASGLWSNWGDTATEGLASLRTSAGDAICRYDFTGSAFWWSTDGLPSDSGGSGFVYSERQPHEWLEPDCHAVVSLGDPLVDETLAAVAGAHQQAWRDHIDRVSTLPLVDGSRGAPALPRRVQIAILDDVRRSQPEEDDFPVTGTSHGQSVALTIRDAVCPAGRPGRECPFVFKSYSVIDDGSSANGSIFELANMIMVAAAEGADVINLSVGFDGSYARTGDEGDGEYTERAKVLRAALEYAACQGSIVVAAAGNHGYGRDVGRNESPMYPAAFAAENRRDCTTRVELQEPLVYTASGVGPGDEDIRNTRPGSRAELAAPAFAVTFADRRSGALDELLPLRTGSSFGAAGVSAVAALVRAYLPEPTDGGPDAIVSAVMDVVQDSAVDLGRPADVCNSRPGSSCNTHRVTACGALDAALEELCADYDYAFGCSWARYRLQCDTPAAGTPAGPRPTDFEPERNATYVPAVFDDVYAKECATYTVQTNGTQDHYCPEEFFDNGINQASTNGQPGDDPCRVCGVRIARRDLWDEYMVVMGLEPAMASSLSAPTLRVGDEVLGLGERTMEAAADGGLVAVRLPSLRYTPASATLSFQNGSQKSVTSQLPIW